MAVLVNVLIPTYNVENYIKECLESVFNQTFQDFDILIIDDCSTDNTINIIESLSQPRIKIITKSKNRGLIDSLNVGFKECKSKYIARVDGDDINDLTRFEKQVSFLEKNPDVAACGSWLQSFGSGHRLIKHKENHEEIMCDMLLNNPMSLGATMLRKTSYKEILFDKLMIHAEDYDFWARTGYTNKMHNLQEVLYYYRIHKNQVCSKFKPIQFEKKEEIKLNLFKKLKYDDEKYSDAFLIKMLFSDDLFSKKDFMKLLSWKKHMQKQNKFFKIYDNKKFEKNLKKILDDLINETFKSYRRGHTGLEKFSLLSVMPLKWKFLGVYSLFILKLKFIFKIFLR